jgi:hypothetical protein
LGRVGLPKDHHDLNAEQQPGQSVLPEVAAIRSLIPAAEPVATTKRHVAQQTYAPTEVDTAQQRAVDGSEETERAAGVDGAQQTTTERVTPATASTQNPAVDRKPE